MLGNKGGITIVNTTQALLQTSPHLEMSGIHLTFLTEDDKVILATGKLPDPFDCSHFISFFLLSCAVDEVLPASWKADLSGEEWNILAEPSNDIFSVDPEGTKGNFNRAAKRLFDSALVSSHTILFKCHLI